MSSPSDPLESEDTDTLLIEEVGKQPVGEPPAIVPRAVLAGDRNAVQALLEAGANPDETDASGRGGLALAVMNGSNEIARLMLRWHADVNARDADGRTPLMLAALTGNEEAVRFLLEHAAQPGLRDKAGDSALVCALFNKYERIAALLRAAGAHD